MKLGPIQEEWVKRLEFYPELQTQGQLGIRLSDGQVKCCCLGEAHLLLCELSGEEPEFNNSGMLLANDLNTSALSDFKKIGLRSSNGWLFKPYKSKKKWYFNLASMNDMGMSWTEIASYIRSNPENVFTHAV